MWVCHISRWAWDTGGRAPNVSMPHQQMGMGLVGRWSCDNGGSTLMVGL